MYKAKIIYRGTSYCYNKVWNRVFEDYPMVISGRNLFTSEGLFVNVVRACNAGSPRFTVKDHNGFWEITEIERV